MGGPYLLDIYAHSDIAAFRANVFHCKQLHAIPQGRDPPRAASSRRQTLSSGGSSGMIRATRCTERHKQPLEFLWWDWNRTRSRDGDRRPFSIVGETSSFLSSLF